MTPAHDANALLLNHPVRVDLVLHDGPILPARFAEARGTELGVVAYHVRKLEAAGVLELVDERQVRGAIAKTLGLTARGKELVPLARRLRWAYTGKGGPLEEICGFLRAATREDPATGRDKHMSGWAGAADALERHFGDGRG